MFLNLIKSLNKTYNKSILTTSCRYLTSQKDLYAQKEKEEEQAALEIEATLFDNSSVKYEPIKKEEVLKKSKQKSIKKPPATKNDVISRPQQFPSFKKSRLEREAESKLIFDQELQLEFFRLSLNDPRLSTLLITVRSKKRRDKNRQIIIEGRRLILEALDSGLKLNSVIFSQEEKLTEIKHEIAEAQKEFQAKIYKVPHHDLKTWSTLTTPPGIMAIFDRPPLHSVVKKLRSEPLPITVVCDNIREPNNLGSIIRTCAALPCLQIVITRGCCDPWESKALRGGCGGHFRLPIRDDVDWQEVPLMIPPEEADNCCIFVAENNLAKIENKSVHLVDYTEVEQQTGSHNVVIIGGESHGVSEEAYSFMQTVGSRGKCLNIPLAQGIESLNVASALTLILYELRKSIIKIQQPNKPEDKSD
ncbi:rRNA methyltransferase 3, mitochondrial [Cochliomyia hominivorax]